MEKGGTNRVIISRLPNGGYLVREHVPMPNSYQEELGAFSTIDEALAFVKHCIEPAGPGPSNPVDSN